MCHYLQLLVLRIFIIKLHLLRCTPKTYKATYYMFKDLEIMPAVRYLCVLCIDLNPH